VFYQNLPLNSKLIALLKLLYQVTHQLPKEYKYSLGQDIINRNWELLDILTLGGGDKKRILVEELSQKFDIFKLRIRFLLELELISLGRAAEINVQIIAIGKLIGKWLKNV